MARILQRTCWIVVLLAVSTAAESRFLHIHAKKAPADSRSPHVVTVRCHPDSLEVVVQADLFSSGLPVDGRHLRLGSEPRGEEDACGAVPSGEAGFVIQAPLRECGTKLSSSKEKIIYSNVLIYAPEPSPEGLLRLDASSISIECHYERKYAVDGVSLQPTWDPFVATATANNHIDFNLQLMTDDWRFERGSYTFFVGDPIHFEVSVINSKHTPLRVYVDNCFATASPDTTTALRYDFIEHHGCLADAVLTNSSSRFLPRINKQTLRFQLDAFRFHQELTDHVYISCYLKAVPLTSRVSSQNRACSFIDSRWRSVDGDDEACGDCNVSHRREGPPSSKQPTKTADIEMESTMTSEATSLQSKHHTANFLQVQSGMRPSWRYTRTTRRESGDETERTIQLGPLTVLPPHLPVTRTPDSAKLSPNRTRPARHTPEEAHWNQPSPRH